MAQLPRQGKRLHLLSSELREHLTAAALTAARKEEARAVARERAAKAEVRAARVEVQRLTRWTHHPIQLEIHYSQLLMMIIIHLVQVEMIHLLHLMILLPQL